MPYTRAQMENSMTNLHSTTGHVPNISALLSAYAAQHRGCAGDADPAAPAGVAYNECAAGYIESVGGFAPVGQVLSAEILGTCPPPSYSFTAQGLAAAAGNAVVQRANCAPQGGTVAFENPSFHGATTGGVCETPPLYRLP